MNNVVKEVSTSNESPAVSTSNESPAVSTSNESPATGIQAVDKINDVGREKPVENSKPFEWKNVPWKSIITLIMFLCVFIVIYPRMDSIFSMIKDLVGLPAAVLDLLQKVWNDIQRDVDPTDPHFWGILIAGIPLAGIAGIAWVFRKVGGDKVDPDMEKILETTGTTKEDYSKEKIEKIKESTDSFKKENNKEKNKLITQYLEIAEKYVIIDIDFETNDKSTLSDKDRIVCNTCQNKKDFEIIDNNIYICSLCSTQQIILKNISSYKDNDRVNISSKYMYDRKIHFRDCINQYQGKQNSTIEQQVYDDLENQFEW